MQLTEGTCSMSSRTKRRDRCNTEYGCGWVNPEALAHSRVMRARRLDWMLRTGRFWANLTEAIRPIGEAFIRLNADIAGLVSALIEWAQGAELLEDSDPS